MKKPNPNTAVRQRARDLKRMKKNVERKEAARQGVTFKGDRERRSFNERGVFAAAAAALGFGGDVTAEKLEALDNDHRY